MKKNRRNTGNDFLEWYPQIFRQILSSGLSLSPSSPLEKSVATFFLGVKNSKHVDEISKNLNKLLQNKIVEPKSKSLQISKEFFNRLNDIIFLLFLNPKTWKLQRYIIQYFQLYSKYFNLIKLQVASFESVLVEYYKSIDLRFAIQIRPLFMIIKMSKRVPVFEGYFKVFIKSMVPMMLMLLKKYVPENEGEREMPILENESELICDVFRFFFELLKGHACFEKCIFDKKLLVELKELCLSHSKVFIHGNLTIGLLFVCVVRLQRCKMSEEGFTEVVKKGLLRECVTKEDEIGEYICFSDYNYVAFINGVINYSDKSSFDYYKAIFFQIMKISKILVIKYLTNFKKLHFLMKAFLNIFMKFANVVKKYQTSFKKDKIIGVCNDIIDVIVMKNLESPIKSVFDNTKKVFEEILRLNTFMKVDYNKKENIKHLSNVIRKLKWVQRGKYIFLINLLKSSISMESFFSIEPHVMTNVLLHLTSRRISLLSSRLYELVSLRYVPFGENKFNDMIMKPIFLILSQMEDSVEYNKEYRNIKTNIFVYLIPKIFDIGTQSCMFYLLSKLKEKSLFESIIFVLNFMKKKNISILETHKHLIERSFLHSDEDVRLKAIQIICMNPKTTMLPNAIELRLARRFIELNTRNIPGLYRGKVVSVFHVFFKNLKNGIIKNVKKSKGRRKKKEMEGSVKKRLDDIRRFLLDVVKFLTNKLTPFCPHEKLLAILEFLRLIAINFSDFKMIEGFEAIPVNIFSFDLVVSLLNSLLDCWDKVRIYIYNVLMLFPTSIRGFNNIDTINSCFEIANKLIESKKLKRADAGALMFRLFFHKFVENTKNSITVIEFGKNGSLIKLKYANETSKEERIFEFVNCFVKKIEEDLRLYENKVVDKLDKFPFFGKLMVLRYLFEDFSFEFYESYINHSRYSLKKVIKSFVNLLSRIVDLDMKIFSSKKCDLVVNFSGVDNEDSMYTNDTSQSDQDNNDVHSLIVNCWLCVREVALIVGAVFNKIPDLSIFEVDVYEKIIQMFLKVLLSCKHYGALNKTHFGFNFLCKRLFSCKNTKIADLPQKYVNYLMDIVRNNRISHLKRSAGIPFAFIAILRNKKKRNLFEVLPNCVVGLCALCEVNEKGYNWKCHVHALNILRCFIRDSTIGLHIFPYLERIFLFSLDGFNSDSWEVRNSSLMCYVALLQRAVGENKANKVTNVFCRDFFTKFPKLKLYMLGEMKRSSKASTMNLFQILLLLKKLRFHKSTQRRSLIEDSKESDVIFLSIIKNIVLKNKKIQIRKMCAKILVDKIYEERIDEGNSPNKSENEYGVNNTFDMLFNINLSKLKDSNFLHGKLETINYFLKVYSERLSKNSNAVFQLLRFIALNIGMFSCVRCSTLLDLLLKISLKVFIIVEKKYPFNLTENKVISIQNDKVSIKCDTSIVIKLVQNVLFLHKNTLSICGFTILEKTCMKFNLNMNLYCHKLKYLLEEKLSSIFVKNSIFKHFKKKVNVIPHFDIFEFVINDAILFSEDVTVAISAIKYFIKLFEKVYEKKFLDKKREEHLIKLFESEELTNVDLKSEFVKLMGKIVCERWKESGKNIKESSFLYKKWINIIQCVSRERNYKTPKEQHYYPMEFRYSVVKSLRYSCVLEDDFECWKVVLSLLEDANEYIRESIVKMLPVNELLKGNVLEGIDDKSNDFSIDEYFILDHVYAFLLKKFEREFVLFVFEGIFLEEEVSNNSIDLLEEGESEKLFGKDEINLFKDNYFKICVLEKTFIDHTFAIKNFDFMKGLVKKLDRMIQNLKNENRKMKRGPCKPHLIGSLYYHHHFFINHFKVYVATKIFGRILKKEEAKDILNNTMGFVKEFPPHHPILKSYIKDNLSIK